MASERRGFWAILESPVVYEAFHHLIGARRWLKRFADEVIQPRAGDRVLDVGCGPGALLTCLPSATYIGFDRNEAYIARARRAHGDRGRFICDDVGNFARHDLPQIDVAVAIGVLHHLDDALALGLMRDIASILAPAGRLITVDPCLHPEQSPIQRFVVTSDRGKHVRPIEEYVALCRTSFPEPRTIFQRGHVPFPHSICIMQAARQPAKALESVAGPAHGVQR